MVRTVFELVAFPLLVILLLTGSIAASEVPCESRATTTDTRSPIIEKRSPSGAIALRQPAIVGQPRTAAPTIVGQPGAAATEAMRRESTIETRKPLIAYVLSGGGAKGSFEMGAIQRLYEENLPPSIVAGTSVGAINAVKLAEGGTGACTALHSIWRSLRAPSDMWVNTAFMDEIESTMGDVDALTAPYPPLLFPLAKIQQLVDLIRLSGKAKELEKSLSTTQSLYSIQPIRRTLAANLDLEKIPRSGISLRLATVDLASGDLCYAKEDSTICCASDCQSVDLVDATMASASIPVFFKPVKIGDRYFVDGGVREVVPLLHTIQEFEPETTFVVIASPIPLMGSLGQKPNVLDIGKRSLDILTYDVFFNDLLSATGVEEWDRNYAAFFDRDLHIIAPMFEVHDMMEIDPYLIRYNIEYGWMATADVLNARAARKVSKEAWKRILSTGLQESATEGRSTPSPMGSLDDRLREAIALKQTGQYISQSMSPFRKHRRLLELAADITWLRREDLRVTRKLFGTPEASRRTIGSPYTRLTGAGIETLRTIKKNVRKTVLERVELGGELPAGFETWHTHAALNCRNCIEDTSGKELSVTGWIWDAYPSVNLSADQPPE